LSDRPIPEEHVVVSFAAYRAAFEEAERAARADLSVSRREQIARQVNAQSRRIHALWELNEALRSAMVTATRKEGTT